MKQAAARTPDPATDRTGAPAAPAPRRRFGLRTRRAGGRYTRFVALMRIVLPVSAGVLVLLVVIWPQLHQERHKFRLGPGSLTAPDGGGQQALNPRFTGTDKQNRPYNVTADSALQNQEQPDEVMLSFPKADIALKDGSWIALTAERGQFSRQSQMLDLGGDVDLYHDSGFEFRTASARVDLGQSTADGDETVHGQGPFGTVDAEGFRIFESGRRILFTGKAKMVFWPQNDDASAAKGKAPKRTGGERRK
jgi:lipopolysaccharide export system protein LptC